MDPEISIEISYRISNNEFEKDIEKMSAKVMS